MSRIITTSKLNRLWKNGVLNIKQSLESSINTEKTERKAEIATERKRIDELEETGGTVVANKLSTYNDIMANKVEGYLPDALAVKEGFSNVNDSLGGLRFGTDGDGNYGYYGADDSLIPFSSNLRFRVFYEAITTTEKSFTVDGTIKFVSFAFPSTNGRGYYDSNKSTTSWYDFNNVEKYIGEISDASDYMRITAVTGDTVTFVRNAATTTKTFVIVGYSPSSTSLPIPSVVDTLKLLGSVKHDQGKLGELFTATKGMEPFTIITDALRINAFRVRINDTDITDTEYITRTGIESELNTSNTVLGYVTVTYPLNEGDVVAVTSSSGGSAYTFALGCKIDNHSFLGSVKHDKGELGELFTATKGMKPFTIITDALRINAFRVWINDTDITDTEYITIKGIELDPNTSNAVLGYVTVTYPLNEGDVVAVTSSSGGSGYTFALRGTIKNLYS